MGFFCIREILNTNKKAKRSALHWLKGTIFKIQIYWSIANYFICFRTATRKLAEYVAHGRVGNAYSLCIALMHAGGWRYFDRCIKYYNFVTVAEVTQHLTSRGMRMGHTYMKKHHMGVHTFPSSYCCSASHTYKLVRAWLM